MSEKYTVHLEPGEVLVYLTQFIRSFAEYREEEEKLAWFIIQNYWSFFKVDLPGKVQSWIRDEEFNPHVRQDIENGFTPAIGVIVGESGKRLHLTVVLPDEQLNQMSGAYLAKNAWGNDPKHRSKADVVTALKALLFKK